MVEHLQGFQREIVKEIGEFMDKRIRQSEVKFAERLHDSETRLLKAFNQYQEHSDVRMRYLGVATPTSTTVQISRLADPDAMVEIEMIAVLA